MVALIVLICYLVVRLSIELSAPERDGRRIVTALRVLTVATRLEPGCLSCGIWTELGEDSYLPEPADSSQRAVFTRN